MQPETPLRAAIYCRISETDNKFDKVEDQHQTLLKFCEMRGYRPVEPVYSDDGVGAWKDDVEREHYNAMRRAVPTGTFDIIVATFQDRLSRRPLDIAQLLDDCRRVGVVWDFASEMGIDPSDPDHQQIALNRATNAGREMTLKNRKQKARFEAERLRGNPLWGVRPFGFVDLPVKSGERQRVPHPEESAEARWAYAQIIEGKTLYSIMKDWNGRGITTTRGKAWSYATIQQLLRRESNVGLWKGTPMNWEPIIDREAFDAVQMILQRPDRAKSRVREPRWLMAGIGLCATCGAPLRSAKGSDRKTSFPVYRCSSTMTTGPSAPVIDVDGKRRRHGSVKCEDLDRRVQSEIAAAFIFASTDLLPGTEDASDLHRAQAELAAIRASLDQVAEAVGDPDFPTAVLKKKAAALRQRETGLAAAVAEIINRSAQSAMLLSSTKELFAGPRVSINHVAERKAELEARFGTLPLHQRRTLVRAMLEVRVETGRTLDRIKVHHKVATALNEGDEE